MEDTVRVAIAGIGGQGAVLFGRLLAEAGLRRFRQASYFPYYATVMRGGASECLVALSNADFLCPLRYEVPVAIVMDSRFLEQYERRLLPGGTMILDSSVVHAKVKRDDAKAYYVPATEVAIRLGSSRAANMVLLGAYLAATGVIPLEVIEEVIQKMFAGREQLLSLNREALREGARLIGGGV